MKKVFILFSASAFFVVSCKKVTSDIKPATTQPTTQATVASSIPLSARFTYTTSDPINIFENQLIKFNNISTGAVSCVWEFGNTAKSQKKDPTMSYPWHGYYTVKLTVFDANGNKKSFTKDISILCLFYNGVHPTGTGG